MVEKTSASKECNILRLDYSDIWRTEEQTKWWLHSKEADELKKIVKERDNYTCVYCGFWAEKYQTVDHISGDPANNDTSNLQTVCRLCHYIKNCGFGCTVAKVVDLYEESKYNQNEIMRITRKMRKEGKTDEEIIEFLGLRKMAPFKQNREYLHKLFGFVSSRKLAPIPSRF